RGAPTMTLMLRKFRNRPIRQKLTLLMVLSAAVSLVFAATSLIAYARVQAQKSAIQDLRSITTIAANNVSGALAFKDDANAKELLRALRAKPELDAACVYAQENGSAAVLFAGFTTEGAADCAPSPGAPGLQEVADGQVLVE